VPALRDRGSVDVRVVDLAVAAAGTTAGELWSGLLRDGFAGEGVRLQQGSGYGVEVETEAGV